MVVLIDPPEGDRYGFPTPAPAESGPFLARLPEWLVDSGYPAELVGHAARFTRILRHFADEIPSDQAEPARS